jgi:hypothetical protein
MADWSLPTLTSTYANFRQNLVDRDVEAATQFSLTTPTNTPTGAIKWDTTLNRWQKWSGTAWGELATTYALTGLTVTSFSNTGNTTLGDSSADTVTVNANTMAFPNGVSISGNVTYSGLITFTGNVTFGDAAGDTVTLVGTTVNLATGTTTFAVGTANFSVGLQVAGSAVLSAASTATLTNKTFDTAGTGNVFKVNGNSLTATAGTATVTVPNSTTTLVGRDTTDTLTNKTITAAASGSSVKDSAGTAFEIGYMDLPQNAQSAAYTLALSDRGKHISITTGGVVIPANGSVSPQVLFPIGTTIVVFNNSATAQNISITTDTLRQSGTTNVGTRSLAGYGMATLVKIGTTVWAISGAGVS